MSTPARSLAAAVLVATLAALASACDDKARRDDVSHATAAMDLHVPAAPPEAPLSGELVAKAREVQVVARALAATCNFDYRSVPGEDVYFDYCAYKDGDPAKLHDAVSTLVASGLVPDAGPASSFAEEARMFDRFVADASKTRPDEDYDYRARQGHSRGTLSHYQDLASAWNAMVPQDPVPVDEGAHTSSLAPPNPQGPRHWQRCGGLACVKIVRAEGARR